MVYYYTSHNVIMLKNIIADYEDVTEMSPSEYIQIYIKNCAKQTSDLKLCWIVETFLDIDKHGRFLNEIIAHLPTELSTEDKEYFKIILHGIIFQISISDITLLYKCLFNLSKQLLLTLTCSLKDDNFLALLSQRAYSIFDRNYTTEKIINPILQWQPGLDQIAQIYFEHLSKTESLRAKQPTIPVQPNVLKRKSKGKYSKSLKLCTPSTPPKSVIYKSKRMLTKSDIDIKLQKAYDDNKQKSKKLLEDVRTTNYHHMEKKSNEIPKKSLKVQDETDQRWKKPFQKSNQLIYTKLLPIPVKETAATLKRFNQRIKLTEQEEIQWLQDLINDCKNTVKIQELEEYDREERERERLIDIEKKHLQGQLSFEDAVLAKKKVQEENKKKYEEVLNQKELWNKEIEKWNEEQMEINRKNFEKCSLIELNVMEARRMIVNKKKEVAEIIKKESESMLLKALSEKNKELKRKIQMIKEIKILHTIAKRARIPKIIDLTETSGLGLLCEMSIAELQERLCSMKITIKEELETKSKIIKERNIAEKKSLEEARKNILTFKDERKLMREKSRKPTKLTINVSSKEIDDLKTTLEQKRKMRLKLLN
ncbi:unnamed protein product [Parnassius apollo]|uniref:(apollo) hypothetical protein n=1 Tax=Parnassius apollo TaxID=110799 RepID=A0A8S3WLQ8_PARAO|nr:unnamed protein product [Parnassius apollo]